MANALTQWVMRTHAGWMISPLPPEVGAAFGATGAWGAVASIVLVVMAGLLQDYLYRTKPSEARFQVVIMLDRFYGSYVTETATDAPARLSGLVGGGRTREASYSRCSD